MPATLEDRLNDLLPILAGRSLDDLTEDEREVFLTWERNEFGFNQTQYDERDKWWTILPPSKLDDLQACNEASPMNQIPPPIADNDGDLLIAADCLADSQAGRTFQFHGELLRDLNLKRAAYPLDFPPPPQM